MIKECSPLVRQKRMRIKQEDLVSDKEEIKCNNIIKRYKND